MPASTVKHLSAQELLKILHPQGLGQTLKSFQIRPQQQQMMHNIVDAYNHSQISLIEAGTGTGKTIAYLLPALFWAIRHKERTIVSTHTIALQEQLIHKDIPLLAKALGLEVKAVLVKGMNNYLCLRKLLETEEDSFSSTQERQEVEKIALWANQTREGSRSDMPFMPSQASWEKVNAESDTCSNIHCPHYNKCYFFKARREMQDAQILVVNHHMLFADLVCRAETDNYRDLSILPIYDRIIIDEAHHIEEIATEYFSSKVSRLDVIRTLGKLASESQDKDSNKIVGKLPLILQKIRDHYKNAMDSTIRSIVTRLAIDLPGFRRDLHKEQGDLFQLFASLIQSMQPSSRENVQHQFPSDVKFRLLPEHYQHAAWKEKILPQIQKLTKAAHTYIQAIYSVHEDIKNIRNEKFLEELKGTLHDIEAFANRLEKMFISLHHFVSTNLDKESVRWIETQQFHTLTNIHLVNTELDIASSLVNALFTKFSTVVLCSATLTTNRSFEFMRNRLGLTHAYIRDRIITENLYDSPFDYQQQSLLVIPTDMPAPTESTFINAAAERIWETLQTCRGNAFVLFTSYTMLKQCYDILAKRLEEKRFSVFKQGDDQRSSLLNGFKAADYAVLFGTDSFWEGIDIAGENLRCVIIVKLPFKVPTEPIIQARTEAITAQGGNAFQDYAVPNAIVKFKQGCGRLIRTHTDRGCIVCLDNRLVSKEYGTLFLNSLPNCRRVFGTASQIQDEMKNFYHKTYHLVKKNGA